MTDSMISEPYVSKNCARRRHEPAKPNSEARSGIWHAIGKSNSVGRWTSGLSRFGRFAGWLVMREWERQADNPGIEEDTWVQ